MNQQITCRRSTPSTMEAIWVFRAVSFGTFDAQRVSTFGQKRRVAMIQHGKRTTERSSSPVSPTELDRDMTPFSPPLLRRRPVKTGRHREQQEIIPRIAQKSRGKVKFSGKKRHWLPICPSLSRLREQSLGRRKRIVAQRARFHPTRLSIMRGPKFARLIVAKTAVQLDRMIGHLMFHDLQHAAWFRLNPCQFKRGALRGLFHSLPSLAP